MKTKEEREKEKAEQIEANLQLLAAINGTPKSKKIPTLDQLSPKETKDTKES
jgi:hypothetical protein